MARSLGQLGELTYVFFQETGLAAPTLEDFPFCRELVAVPQPRLYSAGRLLRGLVGRWPLPVVNYTSDAMVLALDKVVRGASFDLVHIDTIHMAGYQAMLQRALPAARIFYNWHNIESELMRRYSRHASSSARKFYARITTPRLVALEKVILQSASGHVVCSDREREHLLRTAPAARIRTIINGVDLKYFRQDQDEAQHRHRVVFVGAMAYHANIDAAIAFARNIWPRVYQRFPAWRLTLVGSNPVPAVVELGALPGVEVTGTVPDVRPYYREALAAIVPLRSGSGTRLKILEAMAAGVPVISTTLGAEGLGFSPGRELLIVDDEAQWLPALSSVAGATTLRSDLIRAAELAVETGYDWDALGETLRETYREWIRS